MHIRRPSHARGLAALVVLAGVSYAADGVEPPPQLGPPGTAGLVVWLAKGCTPQDVVDLTGGRLVGSLMHSNAHLFEVMGTDDGLLAIQEEVGRSPIATSVDWDRQVRIPESDRCDAPVGGQVGAQQCTIAFVDGDPTVPEFESQSAIDAVHAEWVQDFSAGMPVRVAVIDTGIDPTHPVFAHHLGSHGWDYIADQPGGFDVRNDRDDDFDGLVDEAWGHGTHVAGTILALDPAASIIPLRVLDADGTGSTFALARAIEDAVDLGARVINLSLSVGQPSLPVALALEHAWTHGTAVFTSAGNLGKKQVLFPGNFSLEQFPELALDLGPRQAAGFDPVVTVGSVNEWKHKSPFSSWGPEVDIVAPGEAIYSAYPGDRYAWWSGTSMACAVASGSASLLLSNGYTTVPPYVIKAMLSTGQSVDWKNPQYAGMLGVGMIHVWHANVELWKMSN